jgi:hypothetical protein
VIMAPSGLLLFQRGNFDEARHCQTDGYRCF